MKTDSQKTLKLLDEWAESWEIDEGDIQKGEEIVEVLRGFVVSLLERGYAKTTMRRHLHHLWLLGGEIIRDINYDPDQRKKPGQELVEESVDEEGGPYCRHLDTETEMKSYDATCKKLHKYLRERQEFCLGH
jgi:hypothetical protein